MAKDFAKTFYSSAQWQAVRNQYAKSVGNLCEICWQNGLTVPGEIVHHKIPLNSSNINDPKISLDFSNLMLVCRECHAMLHESSEAGKRYRIDSTGAVVLDIPPS